jgi:hypothetical protein
MNFNKLVTIELDINTVSALAHENEIEELWPVIGEITEQQSVKGPPPVENLEENLINIQEEIQGEDRAAEIQGEGHT